MKYTTERSKQAILDNFKLNSPNRYFDCLEYLAENCAKYEYDRLRVYYDEDYDCIDVTMEIKDDLIIVSKWFDDKEEFTVEIYDKDKKQIGIVGSETKIKEYFENNNWREMFV